MQQQIGATREAADWVAETIRQEAVREFEQRYGAYLQALILTGSMARGEATVVDAGSRLAVLGDAEFLLIFREDCGLPEDADLRVACDNIEARLCQQEIACTMGANRAHPAYLRRMRPHIYGYELRTCGRVLYGDPEILTLIPTSTAPEIRREDAWELLMNRLVELLQPAVECEPHASEMPAGLRYRTAKLYLDMATSLLVFAGMFEAGYCARAARLKAEASQISSPPFPMEEFGDCVAAATDFKLSGRPAVPGCWEYFEGALRHAHLLWRWELIGLTKSNPEVTDRQLLERWARAQSWTSGVRGWLSQMRKPAVRQALARRPLWITKAWRLSPRQRVYETAARIVFQLPRLLSDGTEPGCSFEDAAGELPLPEATSAGAGWRRFARNIARNYEELLIGTRA